MGFLDKVKSGARSLDVRHHSGFLSHVVEKGEYLGASYLAARINTQYGDKAKFRGVEMTYGLGVLGMIGSILADIFGVPVPGLAHISTVSTAMVGTHFAAMGAQHGDAAARKTTPVLAAPKVTGIGAIPPAAGPGKWLDSSQVQALAHMHG